MIRSKSLRKFVAHVGTGVTWWSEGGGGRLKKIRIVCMYPTPVSHSEINGLFRTESRIISGRKIALR